MKLFFHIVLKDLRRHLWEILIFFATVAAWTLQTLHPNLWLKQNMPVLIEVVFFIIWFYLVIRITQGESLVGESEFWLARPYRWYLLLAEKLFLLLLIINLPFLSAQLYLIHAAGLHITLAILPGLLSNQGAYFMVFTLPAMALAAITEKLSHWLVGAFLLVLELIFLTSFYLRGSDLNGEAIALFSERILLVLGALVIAAILILQYRRHKTLVSGALFYGYAAAVPLLIALFHMQSFVSIVFPVIDRGEDWKLALRSTTVDASISAFDGTPAYSHVTLPITISGLPKDKMLEFDRSRVTLTAANGEKLTTNWTTGSMRVFDGQVNDTIDFVVLPKDNQLLTDKPMHISVELAVSEYRLGTESVVDIAGDHVVIPGYAECGWAMSYRYVDHDLMYNYLDCQHAGPLPDLELLTIHSDEFKCRNSADKEPLPTGATAYNFNYGNNLLTDSMRMNPVQSVGFAFSAWGPEYKRSVMLCRGLLLHARMGHLVRRYRMSVDLGEVRIQPVTESTHENIWEMLENVTPTNK